MKVVSTGPRRFRLTLFPWCRWPGRRLLLLQRCRLADQRQRKPPWRREPSPRPPAVTPPETTSESHATFRALQPAESARAQRSERVSRAVLTKLRLPGWRRSDLQAQSSNALIVGILHSCHQTGFFQPLDNRVESTIRRSRNRERARHRHSALKAQMQQHPGLRSQQPDSTLSCQCLVELQQITPTLLFGAPCAECIADGTLLLVLRRPLGCLSPAARHLIPRKKKYTHSSHATNRWQKKCRKNIAQFDAIRREVRPYQQILIEKRALNASIDYLAGPAAAPEGVGIGGCCV
jgi:hypothetical protein